MERQGLTPAQYQYLLARIKPSRVNHLRGNAHLEAWDVRRHLTRIFGFTGWSDEIIECALVHESGVEKNGRLGWTVVYRAQLRLIIRSMDGTELGQWEDGACGDAANQPSLGDAHDLAMKTALSQALKRCAVNLGDQFGLGLYNDGKTDPVVNQTLAVPGELVPVEELQRAAAQDAPVVPESAGDPTAEPGTEAAETDQPEPGIVLHADSSAGKAADPAAGTPAEVETPAKDLGISPQQQKRMFALWRDVGYEGPAKREERLQIIEKLIGHQVGTTSELTYNEASGVIQALVAKRHHQQRTGSTIAA